MPRFYSEFGLDKTFNNNEEMFNFINYATNNANYVCKGYKYLFLRHDDNALQMYLTYLINETDKSLELCNIDTHIAGRCVWNLKVVSVDYDEQKKSENYSAFIKALCTNENDEGMVVVDIINPDALPRIGQGEIIKAQVMAFPCDIKSFKNEKEYRDFFPKLKRGIKGLPETKNKTICLAPNTCFPFGFMHNHQCDEKGEKINCQENNTYQDDDIMSIAGEITKIEKQFYAYNNEKSDLDILTIKTNFGPLQIAVSKKLFNIDFNVGEIVLTQCVVSGDVLIDDYDKGAICDKEHYLSLFQDACERNDFSRFYNCIVDDCVYTTEWNDTHEFIGKEKIIEHLESVIKTRLEQRIKSFPFRTVISMIEEGETELIHCVGEKCVVVADDEKDNFVYIAFIDCNEENKINKIEIVTNSRYHFAVEEKE